MTEFDGTDSTSTTPAGPPLVSHTYDWSTTSPVEAIVETLSATTGTTVTAGDPLQNAVDGDALEQLVTADEGSRVTVTFHYSGHLVSITASADVSVYEA